MAEKIAFTEAQQKIIENPIADILASAAAGSGKTAVLSARIIREITGETKKTDIDRILVVTFTKNAAANMKEKIFKELSRKLDENPTDRNLLQQMNRMVYANISTIDSFCQTIVKNHFEQLNLDPNFRIGDETELKLLKEQAMDQVIEEALQDPNSKSKELVRAYGGRDYEKVRETIFRLFTFADSAPWPVVFLESMRKLAADTTPMKDSVVGREAFSMAIKYLKKAQSALYEAIRVLTDVKALEKHLSNLQLAFDQVDSYVNCKDYTELSEKISEWSIPNSPKTNEELKATPEYECFNEAISVTKSILGKLKKDFFFLTEEDYKEFNSLAYPFLDCFITLTLRFIETYAKILNENNVYGFAEIEHFALQILRTPEGELTETARALSKEFDEIMIDEYQDSNEVQEWILQAVSQSLQGGHNTFCVGDVKQSIYRFRMAKPDLFIDKYNRYPANSDGPETRLSLAMNFRSRNSIVEFVNRIFRKIMIPEVGGVAYDRDAELVHGHKDEPAWNAEQEKVEYHLVPGDSKNIAERMIQAIIQRIQELTNPEYGYQVTDSETGKPRFCTYKDIVILLRGMGDYAYQLLAAMQDAGISAYAPSMEGYFNTPEVVGVLNLLRVLDNPLQDIPMAAVLHSPMFGWTENELALLKKKMLLSPEESKDRKHPDSRYLFDVLEILAEEKTSELSGKAEHFRKVYKHLQEEKSYRRLSDYLLYVYEYTGYYRFCSCLEAGESRRNNLDVLVFQAKNFESGVFSGLSDFVNYIDKKISFSIKVEDTASETTMDAVRLMTIHKSKGLEFPVVILPHLEHGFNLQDAKKNILIHEGLGLGTTAIRLSDHSKRKTLSYHVIANKFIEESLGEELRILYTALTRPQDKLILYGMLPEGVVSEEAGEEEDTEECSASAFALRNQEEISEEPLGYYDVVRARSYQDWIQMALTDSLSVENADNSEVSIIVDRIASEDSMEAQAEEEKKETNAFLTEEEEAIYRKYTDTSYAYQKEANVPVKCSVSDLKMAAIEALTGEETIQLLPSAQKEKDSYVPSFLREKEEVEKLYATDRGTIVHRVMELHDFAAELSVAQVEQEMKHQMDRKRLDSRAFSVITPEAAREFYESEVGLRMREAARKGKLYKEQSFVMSVPATEIRTADYECDSPVLVQGIIDVFFEEEDGIVLLDYKTDRVKPEDGAEYLKEHYREQMHQYARAIEGATGKKVKEQIIYSFLLKKCILL